MCVSHVFTPQSSSSSFFWRNLSSCDAVIGTPAWSVICQIADRLPFTGDTLVSSKIGKIVRKLAKDAPIPGESPCLS